MIDFRKKDLYTRDKKERRRFEKFLDNKLVAGSEDDVEDDMMEELSTGSFSASDAFDLDSGGEDILGDDSGFGGFGDAGDRSGVKGDESWKKSNPILTFLFAPGYMIMYIFKDFTQDAPKASEWKGIVKVLNTINLICFFTALLALLIGLNTIFTPTNQMVVGIILFVTTTLIVKYGYKEDTWTTSFIKRIFGKDKEKANEELDMDFDFGDEGEESTTGFVFEDITGDSEKGIVEDEDEIIEDDDDEDEDSRYKMKGSPVLVDNQEDFERTMLEVYKAGRKNVGREIQDRLKLVKSFEEYLIQNDTSFGTWKRPRERGTEYNNIAYALFKALCKVDTALGSYTPRGDTEDIEKMIVHDIRKSPLLYRIELGLPDRIKEKKIQANIKEMEDMLRQTEDDLSVSILVSTFQGNIVIKLMRLDNPPMVSVGDILRFHDEDRGNIGMQAFDNPKYGLPILFGLQNNEFPYIVDLEGNTSGAIAGGSGSGKSWTTFEMMMNFVISNDYNNVQFVVMDAKNAPFWNAFARFPHVLGYHYEIDSFIGVLEEVEQERRRRQEVLQSFGEEDLKGYRKRLREEGNYEELKKMPLLFVVIDEITATMTTLKDQDEELFKTMAALLGQIATQGRSSGVRILSIGQRTTFDSIPKTLMANSSFKFGMKMEVEADFDKMFGEDIKNYKRPNTLGMGLSKVEGTTTLQNIKTLTIGGKNNRQMLSLIRALAFDWIRRSHGIDDIESLPEGMNLKESYNRPMFVHMSKEEMREGKILNRQTVNKGHEFDFDQVDGMPEDIPYKEVEENTLTEDEETFQDEEYFNQEEEENSKEESNGFADINEDDESEQEMNIGIDDDIEESTEDKKEDSFWDENQQVEDKKENKQEQETSKNLGHENELEYEEDDEDIEGSLTDLLGGLDDEGIDEGENKDISENEESKKDGEFDKDDNKDTEIDNDKEIMESKKYGDVKTDEDGGTESKKDTETHESKEMGETDFGNVGVVKDEDDTESEESKKEGKLDEEGSLGYGSIEDLLKQEREESKTENEEQEEGEGTGETNGEQNVKDDREVSEPYGEDDVKGVRTKSEMGGETGENKVKSSQKRVDLSEYRKERYTVDKNEVEEKEQKKEVQPEKKSSDGEIGLNFNSTAREKKSLRKPVHSYVIENGEQKGFNYYISKDELQDVYTMDRIEEALDRFRIIEDNQYYVAKM